MEKRSHELRSIKLVLMCAASLSTFIWSDPASAQDQNGTAAPSASQDGPTIGEVIVTARRREERLQDVPVAVTALNAAQLRERGVYKLEDLRLQTPSFQVQPGPYGSAVPSFQIRGQMQAENLITQDPSVGIYVDEVYQARAYGVNQSMLDLNSAQVLKGPQGTLFGRNTTGGAVLLQSQRPTDQFGGRVTVGFGDYDEHEVSGVINAPVNEHLRFRAAFAQDHHDGYTTNVDTGERLGTENNFAYRLGALFSAGAFESYTTVSGTRTSGSGVPLIAEGFGPATQSPAFSPAAVAAAQARQQALGFFQTTGDETPYPDDVRADAVTNVSSYQLGPSLLVKNIVGYRRVDAKIGVEFDGSDLKAANGLPWFNALNLEHEHQLSDELQLQGKAFDGRLNFVAGGYYFHEAGSDFQQTVIGAFGISEVQGGHGDNESHSVFGQADFELVKDLTLTAGARYSWDRRELTSQTGLSGVVGVVTPSLDVAGSPTPIVCTNGAARPPCLVTLPADRDHRPTWNFGLKWKPAAHAMVYATVSRGYRSGGWNLRGTLVGTGRFGSFGPFLPEIDTSYEVGAKLDWRLYDMPARLDIAAYHQKYDNIQRTIFAQFPGETTAAAYILNAASAKINGVEVEASLSPASGLELSGFASWTGARYDRFSYHVAANPDGSGVRTVDASGIPFSGTPEWKGGVNARYTVPLSGELGRLVFNADFTHQSRYYWDDTGTFLASTGAYGLGNVRAEWDDVGGRDIDLAVYVRNVTDRHYKALGANGYSTLGFISYIPGDPRTFGATLTVRY